MSVKIITPWNKSHTVQGEVNELPSLTIPDQSMSVREIMDRYARGLSFEDGRVPIYEGEDETTPDIARMELTDRMDLLQANAERIEKLYEKALNPKPAEPVPPAPPVQLELPKGEPPK